MTHVGYIVAAYSVTFGAVAVYAAWLVARSRAVTRTLAAQADSGQESGGYSDHFAAQNVETGPDR